MPAVSERSRIEASSAPVTRARIAADGTLVVPAHTSGNCDPATWGNPPVPEDWWPVIRAELPAFEPRVTPTDHMGAIAELARTWPGALRSAHPQVSFAAVGPQAEAITSGHALDSGFGERSPLARVHDLDGDVLLLGEGEGRLMRQRELVGFAAGWLAEHRPRR